MPGDAIVALIIRTYAVLLEEVSFETPMYVFYMHAVRPHALNLRYVWLAARHASHVLLLVFSRSFQETGLENV